MPFYCKYSDRPIDIQIRIDNLMNVHNYKYPLSWYESLPDKTIRAIYRDELQKYVKKLQTG